MTKDKSHIFEIIIFLLVLSVFIISFYSQPQRQKSLYGSWKGEHQGFVINFIFNQDGTCLLIFKDPASGSTEKLDGKYQTDFSKKPIPLTIRNIPQLNYSLHTIFEFTSNDSIRIANFSTQWRLRPISFDRSKSIKLKRESKAKS
jgi:hypothetical protein